MKVVGDQKSQIKSVWIANNSNVRHAPFARGNKRTRSGTSQKALQLYFMISYLCVMPWGPQERVTGNNNRKKMKKGKQKWNWNRGEHHKKQILEVYESVLKCRVVA